MKLIKLGLLGVLQLKCQIVCLLMNKFSSEVVRNILFLPSVVVVNKQTREVSNGFYNEFGNCLKGKEGNLLQILRETSPQDWSLLIEQSKLLNPDDDDYRYESGDHRIFGMAKYIKELLFQQ